MPGLGLGLGLMDGAMVGGAAASTYLPTVSAAPYAAYGAKRIVSGYSGNLFTLRKTTGGTTQSFGCAAGSDLPDYAAIATFAAGSLLTVATWFDQSGNGRDITQATAANQPAFDAGVLTGGVAPITFDGQPDSGRATRFLQATGLGLNTQAHSVFLTSQSQSAGPTNTAGGGSTQWEFGNVGGGTAYESVFDSINGNALVRGANITPSGAYTTQSSRSSISTYGVVTTAAGATEYINDTAAAYGVAITSQTMSNLWLGKLVTSAQFDGRFKAFGWVAYPATLSAPDASAVVTALNTIFAVSAPTSGDYMLVADGDSLTLGYLSTMARNRVFQELPLFSKKWEVYNFGVSSQTVVTHVYPNRVARFGAMLATRAATYATGHAIFTETNGINDIRGSTSGASLYSTMSSLVSYVKGLGFKVGLATLLPNTDASYTGAMETERLAYNSAVVGNAAGADFIIDYAADATMGALTAPNNTNLYADKLHPTNLGYANLAAIEKAAIQAYIGTSP